MKSQHYDVKCLSCSEQVGQIIYGTFVPSSGHRAPAPRASGLLRCEGCGGSLYFESADGYASASDRADLLHEVETRARRRRPPA